MSNDETAKVIIQSKSGTQEYSVRKGLSFQALCAKHKEAAIEFDCKEADCGICIVHVKQGMENLSSKTPAEEDFLKAMHADSDERLACQVRIFGDVTVYNEFG